MNNQAIDTPVKIMGKTYQIKCPPHEIDSLQQAAAYLEKQMITMRETSLLSIDGIVIVTALNVINQLFMLEKQQHQYIQSLSQQVHNLQIKIEQALQSSSQQELAPAE